MKDTTYGKLILPILAAMLYSAVIISAAQAASKENMTMFLPNTDWPPYVMNGSRHPDGGILAEVFKTIAEPLGYTARVEFLPERRGWEMLDDGLVDVYAKAKEWVHDAGDYLWTDPFLLSEDILLSTTEAPLHFTTPEALYGKSLAAIRGFVYPKLEEHFGPGKITRVDVTTPYDMLRLLNRDRVDGALVNKKGTQWMLRQHPSLHPETFHFDEKAFDSAEFRFLFNKKGNWEHVRDRFNEALRAMKKDGRLKAILDNYR